MTTTASLPTSQNLPLATSMVSQPLISDRTVAVRRPASLSSRSTTTRRYRSHRSHHGGSSYLPQNEFPNFSHTGDVEILIAIDGQEKRYMLHRLILAQCSGFFEASTSEAWSRHQTQITIPANNNNSDTRLTTIGEDSDASSSSQIRSRALIPTSQGQKPMWRYELDTGDANAEDEIPMLVQKPFTAASLGSLQSLPPPPRDKPEAPSNGFFRSMAAMQSAVHLSTSNSLTTQPKTPESEIIRDYDNLFRIFYNYPPNLDSVDITEAYIQCKTLLTVADLYDALEVVGPRIEHHLLQFQSRLWRQIAKYAASYLKLGFLARSKVIFAEALVHVVGQWPMAAPQLRSAPDSMLDLIEDKFADLDDLKARIEGRLFRLNFTTSRGERVSPANAYSDWLVVSLFRHWLAENLTASTPPPVSKTSDAVNGHVRLSNSSQMPPQPSANGPPGTSLSSGRVFRLLGAGGPAYLGHDEIKRFIRGKGEGDYTRETVRKFERRMEELKGMAREVVRPLMRNCLELEGGGSGTAGPQGLGYLTCTKVEECDYPW